MNTELEYISKIKEKEKLIENYKERINLYKLHISAEEINIKKLKEKLKGFDFDIPSNKYYERIEKEIIENTKDPTILKQRLSTLEVFQDLRMPLVILY
ncbi:hypothetical protein [Bizionia sp.]|uniref:hypothetical protein n=1 Tax=Bizionia sp. TaxID=1954480 RepID=UPI003A8E39F6